MFSHAPVLCIMYVLAITTKPSLVNYNENKKIYKTPVPGLLNAGYIKMLISKKEIVKRIKLLSRSEVGNNLFFGMTYRGTYVIGLRF